MSLGRVGVPDDVRQELARGREDELLLRMTVLVVQIELQLEARAARRLLGDRAERRLEPGLLEHVRVEVEDGLAQLPDRLGERGVGAVERGMRERLARLLELVARREQVLDRVVVQGLGERLALALLGLERVREQPRPRLGEPGDELGSAREQQREEDAGDADPGEEARLRDDEARRLRLPGGGVGDRLDRRRRPWSRRRRRGDRRAEAEGDRDRHEEEREPGVRERAAGEHAPAR